MWLIFANNSKVAVAQKAPLEQRHAVCASRQGPPFHRGYVLIVEYTVTYQRPPWKKEYHSIDKSIQYLPIQIHDITVAPICRYPRHMRGTSIDL